MAINLATVAKQKKIKYFLISFVDLFGVLRSKLVQPIKSCQICAQPLVMAQCLQMMTVNMRTS